jgi:glycosyltransferase involved in cell wall biosynthesis
MDLLYWRYTCYTNINLKNLKKKTFLVIGGSIEKLLVYNKDLFSVLIKILKKISLSLSDRLIVYSENIINEWSLENYKYKTYIAYEHYINIDKFNITKRYMERKNCIGYIGRLSKEKGILNFIESIPLILKGMPSLSFIIGGDGKLRNYIEEYIEKTKVNKNVSFVGWIPHKELPKYLNQLKLLVLPSYTEGLPNIMLEAMACGTPVLVTGVGAITDIIEDNKTGFILKDNSSEYISQAIQNIFTCHNQLSKVSKNSRDLIERKFTYEKTVDKWRIILHGSNQK